MTRLAVAFVLAVFSGAVLGAGGGGDLMHANVDVTDRASLQRGAKLFQNYCMGCHSVKYLRYNRLGEDLGIPEGVVEKYLIWDGSKIQSTMTNAMRTADAKDWFGAAPPDLSLTVRARGADWVYTYLNTFYRDDTQDTGVNNLLLAGSSMPHVLWRLQGVAEPVYAESRGSNSELKVVDVKVPEGAGTLSEDEFHRVTRDITNFMAYAAEPIQATRERMGIWVMLFLFVFLGVAYLLKREYWKDIH